MKTPKCTSKSHGEFTCLGAYYQNRKFSKRKWCEACKEAFAGVEVRER